MKITLSKQQWQFIGKKAGWIKTADTQEEIANALKTNHPTVYKILSRMPGFGSALDIISNIQNNKVTAEDAGINQDTINQAQQIVNKLKPTTASSKVIVKEAGFNLDGRIIAAIIVIILGIVLGKSMLSDIGTMKAIPSQAEQVSEQLK